MAVARFYGLLPLRQRSADTLQRRAAELGGVDSGSEPGRAWPTVPERPPLSGTLRWTVARYRTLRVACSGRVGVRAFVLFIWKKIVAKVTDLLNVKIKQFC